MPRPPAFSVTGPPFATDRFTTSVLRGPRPWPTTLTAIEAMPRAAMVEATTNGLLFLLSPKPWPKIATGHPVSGGVPAGRNRLK